MISKELREKFIKFFEGKGHQILPSSSLIPEDDPSVLLTTAGMQQFKKWFSGVAKPQYGKAVTIQKCVRIGDIEEVGDSTHLSFFEMLGNFSFNSAYWKKEAIEWGIEFIRDKLGISFDRMSFTYFLGDGSTPKDEESLKVLKELNIPNEKIQGMGREDNFWGPTGDEGPCGPTVEIYVDGVEVWNLVFNEFYRTKDGKYKSLKAKGVDTGAGFERVLAVINGKESAFDTDLFAKILKKVEPSGRFNLSGMKGRSVRVVADHLRAATFLLADGVRPSNLDKGYVLRRLIRRAIRHGRIVQIDPSTGSGQGFCSEIAKTVIEDYKEAYPELSNNQEIILEELRKEEEKFSQSLERGLKEFEKLAVDNKINGKEAFDLFQTYGFPLEMTEELAKEKGFEVDKEGFEKEFIKHQEVSRASLEKKFKGGLETGGEMETKYHTATHLLHKALKIILGDHVKQAGSNITAERLRFDFSHPEKMTPEEITEVENLVNEQIKAGLTVNVEEMTVEEAREKGAVGLFEAKYGEKVNVYSIGDPSKAGQAFSVEICGGPHVKNTSELGIFKITKEESSSAGIRRIKAVLE